MGKQKIINEDVSLNFRISKELKEEIRLQAKTKNITISKYLRELLEDVHDGTFCDEVDKRNEVERFVYSKGFVSLIIWIYSKSIKQSRLEFDTVHQIDDFISIIKQADRYLPTNLVKELDKVLLDLYRIKTAPSYDNKEFKFWNPYNESKNFDFTVLDDFIFNYPESLDE